MPNKILIVDDEPFNLDLLEQELADQDYTVERANDGVEALAKVESFAPDVVLLDYMMPNMNGIEVVRRLRQDERFRSLPVILVTAKGSQEDKVRGLDAGADDYVVKPFDSFELGARVRSMLRIKRLHEALEDLNRSLADRVAAQVGEIERMGRLKRYLSPQVADTVLEKDEEALLKTHRREITVAFLDLRGFTAFADGAEPEEIMDLLRLYHAEMGRLIFKYEATLERFAGDGIMVFLNDPVPCADHTERAVRMAVEMRARAKELREAWQKKGYDLDLGIGIACSYATLGNVGFEGRMDYGAIGNVTNLASRLCDEAKGGQILTNQKTLARIEHLVETDLPQELQLKGFARPVTAYNIARLKA